MLDNQSAWVRMFVYVYDATIDTSGPVVTVDVPDHPGLTYFLSWTVEDASPISGYGVKEVDSNQSCEVTGTILSLPASQNRLELANSGKILCVRARDANNGTGSWAWLAMSFTTVETLSYTLGGVVAVERIGSSANERLTVYQVGDHLGSASLVLDAEGNSLAEARYLPFGEERWNEEDLPTDRGYTNQRNENYSNNQREQFVRDFGLLFAGIRYDVSWQDAVWEVRGRHTLRFLNEGTQGLSEEYLDTINSQTVPLNNQSHHYAGLFVMGFFTDAPIGIAVNIFRDTIDPGLPPRIAYNPGDIALGNVAARQGDWLQHAWAQDSYNGNPIIDLAGMIAALAR